MTRETRTLCSQEAIAMIRGTSDDIIGYLPKTKWNKTKMGVLQEREMGGGGSVLRGWPGIKREWFEVGLVCKEIKKWTACPVTQNSWKDWHLNPDPRSSEYDTPSTAHLVSPRWGSISSLPKGKPDGGTRELRLTSSPPPNCHWFPPTLPPRYPRDGNLNFIKHILVVKYLLILSHTQLVLPDAG